MQAAQAKPDWRAAKQLSGVPPPCQHRASAIRTYLSAYSGALELGLPAKIRHSSVSGTSLHRPERTLLVVVDAEDFQNDRKGQAACVTTPGPPRAAPLDRPSTPCSEATRHPTIASTLGCLEPAMGPSRPRSQTWPLADVTTDHGTGHKHCPDSDVLRIS